MPTPPDQLHNNPQHAKTAIVTGAGTVGDGIGNGRATAILLARAGFNTLLLDLNKENLAQTQKMIRAEGYDADTCVCDVARESDCAAAAEHAFDHWGRIDVLVNIVGINGPSGTAIDVNLDKWEAALHINVTSMMLMARYVLPYMISQHSGSIVNVASVAGLQGGHPSLLYPTSKGAVVNMTRAMAAHHGRDGVRVNCVAPGLVYTPMVYAQGMSESMRETRKQRSLLQTEGTAWDVANAIKFLASDASKWITGVILPVDAGATAGRIIYSPEQAAQFTGVMDSPD